MKKESTLKLVGLSALVLIVLYLIKSVLFPAGYGFSMNYNMPGYMGNGYEHGFSYSYGYTNYPALILVLLIKILFVVFIVALIAGFVIFVKNQVFTSEDIEGMKESFKGTAKKVEISCSQCGKQLSKEWKVCPYCGKEVDSDEKV